MKENLWLSVVISAVAIAAIAYLLRRLGEPKPDRIDDIQALARFRADHPQAESFAAVISPDGRAAFVLSPAGGIVGCLQAFGPHWTSRRIGGRDINDVAVSDRTMTIKFADFAWPTLRVNWSSASEAREWADRIDAMRRPDHA